jgi:5'-nucleotidase
MRLTVLHFNDLHGRLDQLPRLFTLIQRERAQARAAGRQVLLLDAGDSSDRARLESDVTQGRANFALLEAMGVEATVIGKGEALHWGRAALARLVASVDFPVLAANLVDCADPDRPAVPRLQASVLLDCGGFPLGLVSATRALPAYAPFGFCTAGPRPALRRAVQAVQAQGARFIILLSHLGLALQPADRAQWSDPDAFSDDQVPALFPEIGVIVGGDTHQALDPPLTIGQTIIVQAGAFGQFIGRLDLDLDDATGALVAHAGRLIRCGDDVPPDPTIAGTLELVSEEAERLLAVTVGVAAAAVPHFTGQPSPLATRVADVLREAAAADLAVFFSGLVSQGLPAGSLTRADLYRALRGAQHVTAADVSGAQIRRLLQRMLLPQFRTDSFNPRRGLPALGLPAASSNVHLSYDLAVPSLTTGLIDGQPLDDARTYRLASTSFTLSPVPPAPEHDFLGLRPGQAVELVQGEAVLWQVVERWLKAHGTVS